MHAEIIPHTHQNLYDNRSASSGIRVVVIDTGVNTSHEEFSGHLSVVNGTDRHGHGSNVAGIIGATADNGKGGAGVPSACRGPGFLSEDHRFQDADEAVDRRERHPAYRSLRFSAGGRYPR